ncbi:MAG: hypothetical protein V3T05_11165, partial [Myxococcota bacterium]
MRFEKLGWIAVVAATGCYSGGAALQGLYPSNPDDTGPQIVWDLFTEPLPEIPFPNDIGTRPDVTAATGRRVNVSREAPTEHERTLRRLVNTMDGFGTFAPLYVRFDGRLDIVDLHRRHNNDDPTDDAIFLVNLNPTSSTYGQPVLLDLDGGRFPLLLEKPSNYFPNDPRAQGSNLLFETYAEPDLNGNGRFDPAEDTDDDGVQDRPNLWGEVTGDPARMDPFLDLISFYELESDTLIIRHVMPLEQASTYAVILTRRLVGVTEQSPIRSPFPAINHTVQTDVLRPLIEDGILTESLGIGLDDIAFAWTFTTQSITKDVEALRAGLYGEGPFARLASDFPPRLSRIPQVDEPDRTDNVHILKASRLLGALQDPTFMSAVGLDPDKAQPIFDGYNAYIESFVFVEFESPALIENEDGVFLLDTYTGEIDYGRETIKMVCTIPKVRPGFEPPFPVTFYSHGYTSSRFEFLGFASSLGRFGLATCAIDAYGHGLPSSDFLIGMVKVMLEEEGLTRLGDAVIGGRSRDLNDDGATDSGGDFWGANAFHTRDVVRQTMVDYFQAVRVLRNFGTETMPVDIDGDGQDEIAGDFNADGVADIGGEQPYSMFGQSLGGIMAALVGPMEPMMTAIAPGSGGAGLFDLVMRSTQGGVVQAVFLPFFGPLIIGVPVGTTGRYELKFDLLDINKETEGADGKKGIRFASIPDLTNNEMVYAGDVMPAIEAVRTRFTPERWQAFCDDMLYFERVMGIGGYLGSLQDHGGNATPVWVTTAHALY